MDKVATMKVLVTGGAGFIGSALIRHLVMGAGAIAINIDKLTYAGRLDTLGDAAHHPNHVFIRADICDAVALQNAFTDHAPDCVIHLAAESHVDRSVDGAGVFVQTNVVGTFTLLEAARAYYRGLDSDKAAAFRFVHVSTDEVFGSLGGEGLFEEATPYDPRSPYSASKAASDHFASAWFHTYGLPVCISNCSNNYGPYQLPEKLIPLMITNALAGKALPVYGQGSNIRDWLHVDDHVAALMKIAMTGHPGQTYNIGGSNERSNLQVVQTICDLLDKYVPRGASYRDLITFVTDRPGHDARYGVDASKIQRDLLWQPAHRFDTGLDATVRWYLDNQPWWGPIVADGHGQTRLGLRTDIAPTV
jgi:dTDP-glucose 4,6-dehydratase